LNVEFAAIPTSKAGTVSQFGIRRQRRSVNPAQKANSTAPASTTGFKKSPTPSRIPGTLHDIAKKPFFLKVLNVSLDQEAGSEGFG